jgi:hypothetical protein
VEIYMTSSLLGLTILYIEFWRLNKLEALHRSLLED